MYTDKMKANEREAVSEMLTQAFYSKFNSEISLQKSELQTIIRSVWLAEADNLGLNVWTVKEKETIIGVYALSERTKLHLTASMLGKVCGMICYLGLKKSWVLLKTARETSRRPEKDEWYIDFIAVKEGYRNQNIGQFIMGSMVEKATLNESINTLSLFVLKDNERARHVYDKFGFKQKQQVKSDKYDFLVRECG